MSLLSNHRCALFNMHTTQCVGYNTILPSRYAFEMVFDGMQDDIDVIDVDNIAYYKDGSMRIRPSWLKKHNVSSAAEYFATGKQRDSMRRLIMRVYEYEARMMFGAYSHIVDPQYVICNTALDDVIAIMLKLLVRKMFGHSSGILDKMVLYIDDNIIAVDDKRSKEILQYAAMCDTAEQLCTLLNYNGDKTHIIINNML